MHSSIKYTFKMVIYGALILALTTFYAVDRVKADTLVRKQNVGINPSGFTMELQKGGTQYHLASINTFNTGEADLVIVPASIALYVFNSNSTTSPNFDLTDYNLLSVKAYLGNFTCQLQSNGFKCPVTKNTNISGNFSIWYERKYVTNEPRVILTGAIDTNFELYKSDNGVIIGGITDINTNTNDTNKKLDDTNKKLDDTNKNIKDTNDTIKSDDVDNEATANAILVLENSLGIDTNFITSLIILPYNLLSTLYDNANVCHAINLGTLFDTDLVLPCIDVEEYLGSNIYVTIDVIMCGICALGFVNSLKKLIYKIMTLSSDIEETADIKIFK